MGKDVFKKMSANLPGVIARAINDSLVGARQAVQFEIRDSFNRPTPYVLSGVRFEKATASNLSGSIYISNDRPTGGALSPAEVLLPHIRGGVRFKKASEAGFFKMDMWLTPGPAAKLDRYGNISAGEMKRILSAAGLAENLAGYSANQTARSRKRNKGALRGVYVIPGVGIFQHGPSLGSGNRRWATKYGGPSRPLLYFAKRPPQYESGRFLFYEAVASYFKKNWGRNFAMNMKAGLK